VAALDNAYAALRSSWSAFYANFGLHQTRAIAELAIHADPIAQEVFRRLLPQLQKEEEHVSPRPARASIRWRASPICSPS